MNLSGFEIAALVALGLAWVIIYAMLDWRKKKRKLAVDSQHLMSDESWEFHPEGLPRSELPFWGALPSESSLGNPHETPLFRVRDERGHRWVFGNVPHVLRGQEGALDGRVTAVMEIDWLYDFWIRVEQRTSLVYISPDELSGACTAGGRYWLVSSEPKNSEAIEFLQQLASGMAQYKYSYIQIKDGFLILGGMSYFCSEAYPEARDMCRAAHDCVTGLLRRVEE